MNDYEDCTTDYKREFELMRGADTEYAELIDGRFARTEREAFDYLNNHARTQ
ncbi:MAG: hypothetical protein ACRDAM_05005 [Casimicrobium sp.]